MNYREIMDEMHELRDLARARDRYFKEEDHEWILGVDVFRDIRHQVETFLTMYPVNEDDVKIMGSKVTVDYQRRTRIDLVRDTKKARPEPIYISTAGLHNDWVKQKMKEALNDQYGRGGFTYFKPQFELDEESLYPKTMIQVCARRGGKTTFSVLDKLDHEFYHNMNWREALEIFMDKHDRIKIPEIDRVIYNNPATIVFWKDGTKTVVKAQDEAFDEEKGLAMAIAKKVYGNDSKYFNKIKKHLPKIEDYSCINCKKFCYGKVHSDCLVCVVDSKKGSRPTHFEPKK